jgi:hypothetical protein
MQITLLGRADRYSRTCTRYVPKGKQKGNELRKSRKISALEDVSIGSQILNGEFAALYNVGSSRKQAVGTLRSYTPL